MQETHVSTSRRDARRGIVATYARVDRTLTRWMDHWGPTLLRWAVGIVFVWFGALKVVGRTPVADLVAATIPWVPAAFVVPALGVFEVLVGLALITGVALRLALLLMWLQMAGTFLTFVMLPHLTFQGGNPLLLTVEGEFVIKNLVLIAAGIAIGGSLSPRSRREGRAPATAQP